jgi:hypothetical protein
VNEAFWALVQAGNQEAFMKTRGLLVAAATVGLSLLPGKSSDAFNPIGNACLGAANATITVTATSQPQEATSPDASYSISSCGGYVVDVVGSGAPPSGSGGLATVPGNKQSCDQSLAHVALYKKAAGAAGFVEVSQSYQAGNWIPPGQFMGNTCQIGGATPAFANGASGDTIRVVIRAVTNASPVKVKVGGRVVPPAPR